MRSGLSCHAVAPSPWAPRYLFGPAPCFFHCSGDHRHLHSFPTRRSSDLVLHIDTLDGVPTAEVGGDQVRAEPVDPRRNRSEEHTSELQSRGHLVCRLLLEKKKNSRTGARFGTGSMWK